MRTPQNLKTWLRACTVIDEERSQAKSTRPGPSHAIRKAMYFPCCCVSGKRILIRIWLWRA